MEGARSIVQALRYMKPEECRELGNLLLELADSPRDAMWNHHMEAALAKFPEPPASTISGIIAERRRQVREESDKLFATGWHPDQMRRKLEEFGYTGIEQPKAA